MTARQQTGRRDTHQHHFSETPVFVGGGVMAVGTQELPAAVGKSEFGVCGVVGGMMVIELLAGTMRRGRGGIAAGEDDMRQTYTVKHIRKGLTLLN